MHWILFQVIRPWHIRRALKRALCILVSTEHYLSIIIKQAENYIIFDHSDHARWQRMDDSDRLSI